MASICDFCEKGSQKGKKIALIWGVKYRSIVHRKPNIRKTKVYIDGEPVNVNICTTCLKSIKNGKAPNIQHYANVYNKGKEPATPITKK
jgi:ribosomal protein L28